MAFSTWEETKSYAVTGANGFLGRSICKALLQANNHVIGIGPGEFINHPNFHHVPAFITDSMPLQETLEAAEVLIHAAGRATPTLVTRLDSKIAQDEIRTSALVFEAAARAKVKKVLIVSSGGTVYGDTGLLGSITETQALKPSSRYGVIKVMIEEMGLSLTRSGTLDCVIGRVSNPYGIGQINNRGQGLIATLIEKILLNQTIPIWGDGSAVRDYIYIDDVAQGLIRATSLPGGTACNIASGTGRSVVEVISDVSDTIGILPRLQMIEQESGVVTRNVLSHALLSKATGWIPMVDWQEGLQRTVEWWKHGRLTQHV